MTATLEITRSERLPLVELDFRELDEQDAELLPSRETMCGWHCYSCHPVYCCYPVYYCAPRWCYG